MEAKLEHLMSVTRDHLYYVRHFITTISTDRSQWESHRTKLIKLSTHLYAGIDDILSGPLISKPLVDKLERAQRQLIKCIQQLLVELGPSQMVSLRYH